ncbi:MAG: tetraacyldisaccharide 4'-kinase [Bacteroidia bacterium]
MFLRFLSFFYGIGVKLRNEAYETGFFRAYHAGIYTLSIGNLSAGGTGKTPVVAYLIAHFLQKGKKVAYLSRGYGRKTKGFLQVNASKSSPSEVGDEALQISKRYPNILVAVCEDRVKGAEELQKIQAIDVLLLDDAFQHRRIYRDKEIVVIDAQHLPTDDYLLPAGRLREPVESLYRADIVVINKCFDKRQLPAIQKALQPHLSVQAEFVCCYPVLSTAISFTTGEKIALSQQKVIAFCGIGNAEAFYQSLEAANVTLVEKHTFKDHHFYTEEEIFQLIEKAKNLPIFTTEKDFARLQDKYYHYLLQQANFYYVPMELTFWEGEDRLKMVVGK